VPFLNQHQHDPSIPTCPVNARGSHSLCGCLNHLWQATRVHMKLVLCWSPHMTGSSSQQMAWHCWTHAAGHVTPNESRCYAMQHPQRHRHVLVGGGNLRGDPCSGRPTRCAEYGRSSTGYCDRILSLFFYSNHHSPDCRFFFLSHFDIIYHLPRTQKRAGGFFFTCFDSVFAPPTPPSHAKASHGSLGLYQGRQLP